MSHQQTQAAASAIDRGTVARSTGRQLNPTNDPNRRRFGYAPGAWLMEIEARLSGRQQSLIPQGVLVLFETGTLRVENFDIEKPNWKPQVEASVPAAEFIGHVKDRFQKPEADYGFRELSALTPLKEADTQGDAVVVPDEAVPYFLAVHPSFAALGHACESGLSVCPTCRIPLLEDEEGVAARAAEAGLDPDVAEALRLELLDANLAYHAYATARWADIVGEMDQVKNGAQGIKALKQGEHHIRRVLHELAPEERAADTAAQYGAQQGAAVIEGMREIADSLRARRTPEGEGGQQATLDVLASIAATLKGIAETQAKQGEEIELLKSQPQTEAKNKGGK